MQGNSNYYNQPQQPYGNYHNAPQVNSPVQNNGKKQKKVSKKKAEKLRQQQIAKRERARTLNARQRYAVDNSNYRNNISATYGNKGLDNARYVKPADYSKKKEKDHYFVMRKFVCFLMFLFLVVIVAVFVLNFLKLDIIPVQYISAFVDTPVVEEEPAPEEEEAVEASVQNAEGDETDEETGDETSGEETGSTEFEGTAYSILDPIFGFIKWVGSKFDMDLNFGDSPMYDELMIKVESGMADPIAEYAVYAYPPLLIIYIIIAVVMLIKAFFGIFGRRMFKNFGLGAILMLICMLGTVLSGLIFTTDAANKLDFGGIMNLITGAFSSSGGFAVGFGLLGLVALPVLILVLSIFCRKKIPYSIFDNTSR